MNTLKNIKEKSIRKCMGNHKKEDHLFDSQADPTPLGYVNSQANLKQQSYPGLENSRLREMFCDWLSRLTQLSGVAWSSGLADSLGKAGRPKISGNNNPGSQYVGLHKLFRKWQAALSLYQPAATPGDSFPGAPNSHLQADQHPPQLAVPMIFSNPESLREWFAVRSLPGHFLELCYPTPRVCLLCATRLDAPGFCHSCHQAIQNQKANTGQCTRCGTFHKHGVYCHVCYHWPEGYIKNTAPLSYQEQAEPLVWRFKYQYEGHLAEPLSLLIFQELCKNPALIRDTHNAIVAPIPMSRLRYLQKGYNHAEVLSVQVAQRLDTQHIPKLLTRTHHTPHQVGLGSKSRRKNLKNAFTIAPHWVNYIHHKTILLVDDVLTTGATLQEAAQTLLDAGAKKVFSVTIATGNPEESKNKQKGKQPEIFDFFKRKLSSKIEKI